ncbi:unnamed protein product [Leptidea sinapis]|uniref:MEIS N-terminal domain-containing protein n=1 Tax=Leptidea sinapis TaxID=189913 RepID=A0A5E4R2M1_9NEOP|nr:unnamed protein product [Leptidea sinapis]
MQGGAAPSADDAGDQAQFEADKRAVYKHPLFPLLALLLERCEQATAGAESPAADAFGADLQAFVQHQRRDRRPFLLEKVQELCRDFCGRYIACLKTKMQSENLLRTDYTAVSLPAPVYPVYPPHTELPFPAHRDPPSLVVQGSTPISQIGAGLLSNDSFTGANSNNSCSSVSGSPPPEEDGEEGGKRGVLPRHATQHPYPTEEEKRTLAAQTRLTLLQVNNWSTFVIGR